VSSNTCLRVSIEIESDTNHCIGNFLCSHTRMHTHTNVKIEVKKKTPTISSLASLFSSGSAMFPCSAVVASSALDDGSSPFSCLEASSAALLAAASCLALSSSKETLRARASSGSMLGSTPKSKPEALPAAAAKSLPPSPSPVKTGVLPLR